jgi:hypothetical protein
MPIASADVSKKHGRRRAVANDGAKPSRKAPGWSESAIDATLRGSPARAPAQAFSSEVDTGSRQANASKRKLRAGF